MDAFLVFCLDLVPADSRIRSESGDDVSDKVLHENRVFIGLFGHIFLIGAFEQGVELRTSRCLNSFDNLLSPDRLLGPNLDGNNAALIVSPVFADRF